MKNGLTEEKSKSTSDTPPVKGPADKKEPNGSSDYYVQLEGLNISVSKWISKHVSENPCCILTPVFRDYEKHLARIEQLKPQGSDNEGMAIPIQYS
jgi:nuclear pore complex protein Nup50